MNKEKRRVPKLRFPGFTEDWEQRKLGDIVDFLDGQRKPLKESERTKGKYPYYGASGIIDYINDYLFDENLVLLSEDGANIIDRNYPVCFIATGQYWVNNHAHVLKVKTGVIDKFICESLERLDYTKFNTGTAQPKLNQDICQKIVITIPNEDEQKYISEFLDRINNIITLHQRKLEHLNLKKKGLLQKLFPKNGERYPELRFPGFTDAWEQRKLGDYLSIPEKEILEVASSDDLITVKLNLGGVELGASRETLSLGSTVYYKRYAGQFIYGKQNFFNGSMGLIPTNLDGKGSSGDVPSFNVSNIEENYLYTYVSRESYWRSKEAAASGTGSKRIHEKTFLDFNIDVPSVDEQKLISNTFDLIDRFITLHQRKLEHLQLQKKALLQQMFV